MSTHIHEILKETWGYEKFRPLQESIIRSILGKRDTIGLLPTGGGKSLCFQVPALAEPGYTLVISPLIALIRDQVDALNRHGVPAAGVSHLMDPAEIESVYRQCREGRLKLLYMSPERIRTKGLQDLVTGFPPDMLVIDEAHCISQWGHDFRPAYLRIDEIRKWLPSLPVHAFTATADKRVLRDIKQYLDLRQPAIFRMSYKRENLAFRVHYTENKMRSLYHFISQHPGSGIIYVRSRHRTESVCAELIQSGFEASFYHAGLEAEDRTRKQNEWMRSQQVMVSTNAFGMGVDKPDVRFVIHLDLPADLESYYQEAGRAGRDGLPSIALVLYNSGDIRQLEERWENSFPDRNTLERCWTWLRTNGVIEADGSVLLETTSLPAWEKGGNNTKSLAKSLDLFRAHGLIDFDGDTWNLTASLRLCGDFPDFEKQSRPDTESDLLRLLARIYPPGNPAGMPIDESMVAQYLDRDETEVKQALRKFQEEKIFLYQEKTEQFRVRMLSARTNGMKTYYRHRRIKERKMQHMIDFIRIPLCRQLYILRYFGEDTSEKCKKCDLCQQGHLQSYRAKDLNDLRNMLKKRGPDEGWQVDELMMEAPFFEQEKFASMLQELQLDGEIVVKGYKIWLSE